MTQAKEGIMGASYESTTGHPAALHFSSTTTVFGRLTQWFAERRRIGQIARELNRYSDRDLADMGLTRGDIPAVARGTLARG